MSPRLRIALVVSSRTLSESPFANGILQNVVALRRLLLACPNVSEVFFANTTPAEPVAAAGLAEHLSDMTDVPSAIGRTDVIISGTATLADADVAAARARGVRCVAHVKGSTYHFLSEQALFPREPAPSSFARRARHDAVWVSPHLHAANRDLLEINFDAPAQVAPLIWSSEFVEAHARDLAARKGIPAICTPRSGPRRVSVFEPNINLVKTCITPVIAIEKAFREEPGCLDSANIFAARELAARRSFVEWMAGLEVQKAKRIFFEARFPIAKALLEHTDIVLCHQRDLELNYLYFDAAWLGFPIVHNSDALRDLGLHYPGFDAAAAARRLIEACRLPPGRIEEMAVRSRATVSRFLWNHADNLRAYTGLLEAVRGARGA